MDKYLIEEYFRTKKEEYENLSRNDLLEKLYYNEHIELENKKTMIFETRLNHFILAKCLKRKMLRETNHKQLKRYLTKEVGMNSEHATTDACKYNKACRTYYNFPKVIFNVSLFPKLDIRDLTINQLMLSVNKDWVERHNALQKGVKRKAPGNNYCDSIDWEDVERSFYQLQSCEWYKKAKNDPSRMAFIMDNLSSQAVRDAQFNSKR